MSVTIRDNPGILIGCVHVGKFVIHPGRMKPEVQKIPFRPRASCSRCDMYFRLPLTWVVDARIKM